MNFFRKWKLTISLVCVCIPMFFILWDNVFEDQNINSEQISKQIDNVRQVSGYNYWGKYYYKNSFEISKAQYKKDHKPIRYQTQDGKEELRKLKDLVQRRLFYLQNPKNCTAAKKVISRPTISKVLLILAHLSTKCLPDGFGSNLHQLTFCLIVAFGTERTFILESKGWKYADEGWETVFLPVSSNCTSSMNETKSATTVHNLTKSKDDHAIFLPSIHKLSPIPDFMPFTIPEDIADRLEQVHVNPEIWWIGQFVEYLIRPNRYLKLHLRRQQDKLSFKRPIVGLHVRRTDKIRESDYFSLEAYMEEVDKWFNQHMVNKTQERHVFIATDSPNVIQEAEKKYPRYIFVYHKVAATNKNSSSRYSTSSLKEMLSDVHTLVMCDFVICTMTSNVCRLVHELKEARDSSTFERTISLDSEYFFSFRSDRPISRAVMPVYPEVIELT